MEKKDQEVAEEYLSSLADLNLNSKPLINMLTILAEENIEFAPVIVKAVEQHIAKVNHDVKLPVLYLIDSIVKNVGREYIQLFSHSIVNIFCGVFEQVNEKIREKMYTLRQTWNDVFTPQKLYTLDVKVNCMDQNWPITAKVVPKSPAIHVNPNFLKNKSEPLNEMEAKLRDKQRQLLELQKRKLELELAATKQRLEEQEKQLQSTIQGDNTKVPAAPVTQPAAPAPPNTAPAAKQMFVPSNKPPAPKMTPSTPASMNFPATAANAPKIRVAPVNSALLNSIRQRDPRLARKQQQHQAALAAANQAASAANAAQEVPPVQTSTITPAEPSLAEKKEINAERNIIMKIPQKSMYGSSNREKSKMYDDSRSSGMYNPMSKRALLQKAHQEKLTLEGKKSPTLSGQQQSSVSSGRTSSKSHSNSSSRTSGSSRSSGRESSKSSRNREKDSSSSSSYDHRERKRKIDSSPNKTGERISAKHTEKSPKRHADNSVRSTHSSAVSENRENGPGSPIKFRDIGKHNIKSRNYMRRNREKSPSPAPPTPPPPPAASSPKQDTDFREAFLTSSASPEKRLKTASNIEVVPNDSTSAAPTSNTVPIITSNASTNSTSTPGVAAEELSGNVKVPSPKHSPSITNSVGKHDQLEKNVEFGATTTSKDIDLRQLQPKPVAVIPPATTAATTVINKPADAPSVASPATIETTEEPKKRPGDDVAEAEEPASKKAKSENMVDSLFGTEDVDLRTLAAPVNRLGGGMPTVMPTTPPPPPIISNESENWAKVKGSKSSGKPSSKSRFEDVRAKLAKAAKGEKYDKELKSFKKATRFSELQEDSQDGTDSNIRTIISQAQEMLQSENMDVDQYNTLMKTVIQINEASKLREAQRRESLLVKKDENQDLTPISDEEVQFSSDEESSTKASRSKIMAKRIPKIPKRDENSPVDSKFEQNSVLKRSPSPQKDSGNSYSDSNRNQPAVNAPPSQGADKFDKREGRPKDSKWSRWEPGVKSQPVANKPKWVMGNTKFRPNFPPPKIPNMINPPNMINCPPVPCPWRNPPQMIFAAPPTQTQLLPPPPIPPIVNPIMPPPDISTITPGPPLPPPILLPQLSNSVDNPNADVVRTINIDGVPKEIRFYDEVAIAFMDWDQPKEIGFQAGQRRIMVDDHDVITLSFNDAYKTVMIENKPHKMRFGCPTRELYIDGNWFECYFGDPPIQIFLDGRIRVFKVEGPAPQVRIGSIRQDLVVGKINLIIDALIIVPVFLDAKVQTFQLDDAAHTLQFADCLKTVLIDSIPFDVEYGGLPKSIYLKGVKHFVRFGTLPNGIVPGQINILNMIRTDKFPATELPLASSETKPSVVVPTSIPPPFPVETLNPGLNAIKTDVIAPSSVAASNGEINDEAENKPVAPAQSAAVPGVGNFSIDELFQKLLASGILNQNQGVAKADEKKDKFKDAPITPIDLCRPETIKSRQSGIIQKLFTGMQCSSCGVRFPPEQTMKYSQHLDWHFRQNRKERDNSRRAHSRKWYYDVSDWIQYEEIEDLDDREKNWFETQQNEAENVDENSNQRTNSPPPSCPAGPDDVDKCCDMCHDKFEQFYNEESEEWHLRDAIRVEDKIYHPICYEDYKASFIADESTQINTTDVDDNAVDAALVKTEKDAEEDEFKDAEIIDDDDDEDDVIVLPAEEPSIQEIPDDDEDVIIETSLDNEILVPDSEASIIIEKPDKTAADASEAMESDDVEIQEPLIPFTDLDTYEEKPQESVSTVDDSSQSSQFNVVKIKEEPKDDGYNEDDAFEECGTIICDDEISAQNVEIVQTRVASPVPVVAKPPATSSSNSNILVLHDPTDGNEEVTPAHTSGVSKIKINISKNTIRSDGNSASATSATGRTESSDEASIPAAENVESVSKSTEEDDFYTSIQYTLKPTLQNVALKKVPRTISGVDTSGLCSIM